MNKKDLRKQKLDKHYKTLEELAAVCGIKNPNGKKLSLALWKIEQKAHKDATDYCNGTAFTGENDWDENAKRIVEKVQSLFNGNLCGLMVNSDPRGYALKIQEYTMKAGIYDGIAIERDWGGYGILSPNIEA